MEKLIESLGEPIEGNEYIIKPIDGEWWIEHKEVGSGEPLKQWIETHLTPVESPEIKVGDKCRVVKNRWGHNFEIGEIITITGIEQDNIPFNCINKYGVNWWCSADELEKL
jgi:hypothetical protein